MLGQSYLKNQGLFWASVQCINTVDKLINSTLHV